MLFGISWLNRPQHIMTYQSQTCSRPRSTTKGKEGEIHNGHKSGKIHNQTPTTARRYTTHNYSDITRDKEMEEDSMYPTQ